MQAADAIETEERRPSLRERDRRPEMMDDPALDRNAHERALIGLARLNRVSRPDRAIWRAVAPVARSLDRPLRLLDVATGGGDVLAALVRRARRAGVTINATGCDISETALERARANAKDAGVEARLVRADALRDDLPDGFDVAMCSLFLHHLDGAETVALLRRMAAAAPMVVASDLVRTRVAYALVWIGSRVLTRSPVVRCDALLSVRAAYTPGELLGLARDAGLADIRIRGAGPARMLLTARGDA